ncbi:MAG TPA: F0F1 ATP synthase subunit delta [Vitreimonas sp.]|nr:F0F1 ATP synthase subunit delta [Vitreimonas sp.]
MGRPTTAARRYAEAAFELATRDGSHEAWARDLEIIAGISADDRVASTLRNASIPHPQRQQLVRGLFESRVSPKALNLVRLLVERRRAELLPAIAGEFRRLLNRSQGITDAVVTSAAPLTTAETEALKGRIQSMAGSRIDLQTQVDESLIGGLTVKVGGRLLDASVRGRLERLRDELVAGTRTR